MTWTAVLATAAGCYLLKLAGLSVPERLLTAAPLRRVAALLPAALLAALAAVQAIAAGKAYAPDGRLLGLAAGVVALVMRAPFLVVVAVAAGTAAAVRAVA